MLRAFGTLTVIALTLAACAGYAQDNGRETMFEEDIIETSAGELKITLVGHGTLMFTFGGKVIHVDPVSREADYSAMPKADVILITHEHGDHLDPKAVALVRKEGTEIVLAERCARAVTGGTVMNNGDVRKVAALTVEAVPAYNILHKRPSGEPFHPRGHGNGYIIAFGQTRVYVAGDTENTPELKQFTDIGVAFMPMNLPYKRRKWSRTRPGPFAPRSSTPTTSARPTPRNW